MKITGNIKIITALLAFLINLTATFAGDSFFGKLSSYVLFAGDEPAPFWLHSNRYGMFQMENNAAFLLSGSLGYRDSLSEKINFTAELQPVLDTRWSTSYLAQAYLKVNMGVFTLRAGKEAYTLNPEFENINSGEYFLSANSRPVPRIGIGIYEFVPLSFLIDFIKVKGALHHVFLTDDRGERGTDNPQLHEKFAYIGFGRDKFMFTFGLNHWALIGGTRPDGTKLPIDYLATFFARASDKVGAAAIYEGTNAAGGHNGLWDIGFTTRVFDIPLRYYFKIPFHDSSGMRFWLWKNHDFISGFEVSPGKKHLDKLVFEVLNTRHQSGRGILDPVYPSGSPNEGELIFLHEVNDYDAFMLEHFGIETNGIGKKGVDKFLRNSQNFGYRFGGRDDYYNNGLYYAGYSYNDRSMGTPFFFTYSQMNTIQPGFALGSSKNIVNNRVMAIHLGAEGHIYERLRYRIKTSYTRNLGTYAELYKGHYKWDINENYYFRFGKSQWYWSSGFEYSPPAIEKLKFNLDLGADFGEMYSSAGLLFSLQYMIK